MPLALYESAQCDAEGPDTADRKNGSWSPKPSFKTKSTETEFWKKGLMSLLLSEEKKAFLCVRICFIAVKVTALIPLRLGPNMHVPLGDKYSILWCMRWAKSKKTERWRVLKLLGSMLSPDWTPTLTAVGVNPPCTHRQARASSRSQRKLCPLHKADLSFPALQQRLLYARCSRCSCLHNRPS